MSAILEPERERITICSRKDFDVSYFVGSGHGGQNRQKCHTGVNIIHRESGAIGRASDSRSQEQNKTAAFKRLRAHPKFQFWLTKKLWELREQETMEESIAKSLTAENLRYEIKEGGKWIQVSEDYFKVPVNPKRKGE